jgi:hypothetical protein
MLTVRATLLLLAIGGLFPPTAAAAQELVSARALGMGDALRSAATGGAGVHLNPSGITLTRSYVMEGGYEFRPRDRASFVDTSIVDTVTSRVGAAVGFTYLTASPKDPRDPTGATKLDRSGYSVGISLALPITTSFSLGLTGRYLGIDTKAPGNVTVDQADGLTLDLGATVRLGDLVNIGAVGYNLVDPESAEAPVSFGAGVSLTPLPNAIIAFDTLLDFSSYRDAANRSRTEPRYCLGAEYLVAEVLAPRLGYVRDSGLGLSYLTAGVSLVSKQAVLDVGLRQQVSGGGESESLLAAALRLFLE